MKKKIICNNNIMLTSCLIVLFIIMLFCVARSVKADETITYEKSFISIEIKDGDTLTSIAQQYARSEEEYQEYVQELKQINNLNNDVIHSGCFLLVPVYEIAEDY